MWLNQFLLRPEVASIRDFTKYLRKLFECLSDGLRSKLSNLACKMGSTLFVLTILRRGYTVCKDSVINYSMAAQSTPVPPMSHICTVC